MDQGIKNAVWVSCAEQGEGLPVFRCKFEPAKPVSSARLAASALGCYLAFLNGERIGSYELEPGTEEMARRKRYTVYDVTSLMREGENVLSAVVGSGWWSGRIAACYGKEEAFLAELVLRYEDGTEERVCTGPRWKSARKSAYRAGDIYDGERYDARISDAWKRSGFDDSDWLPVCENMEFSGEIEPFRGPHITVKKELERSAKAVIYRGTQGAGEDRFGTISVLRVCEGGSFVLKAGETALVDFGQNFSGWERFSVSGARGTVLTIRHGEILNTGEGEFSRNNDGAGGSLYRTNYRSAKATTEYVLSGERGETYRPSLTYYGFRYLEIEASGRVEFSELRGEVISSVPRRTGQIETSHALLNRLIENAVWGQYSNYVGVPTDCPQRDERLGWTADTQVFAETGCFLADSKEFLEHYLVCMRDAQKEDGSFSGVAPTGQYNGSLYGGFGWADAGVLIPHTLWKMYGDAAVIRENWSAMQRYVDGFLGKRGGLGGLPHWGDWLSFESNDDEVREILGVCYYAWDLGLMAEMAGAIGLSEEKARYHAEYLREREFFRGRYLKDGKLVRTEQSVCAHALYLGMLSAEEREKVAEQLVGNLKARGYRLGTGFLGTKILLDVLTKIGHSDVAYSVLLGEECPSWLYPVKLGATTFWERWDSYTEEKGFADKGMNSFNHYAYGAVVGWMFGAMAGINAAKPGFAEILLAPHPDARVARVKASFESVHGKIGVNSFVEGRNWTYTVVVPAGVSAVLRLPAGTENAVLDGKPISGEAALSHGVHTLSATY